MSKKTRARLVHTQPTGTHRVFGAAHKLVSQREMWDCHKNSAPIRSVSDKDTAKAKAHGWCRPAWQGSGHGKAVKGAGHQTWAPFDAPEFKAPDKVNISAQYIRKTREQPTPVKPKPERQREHVKPSATWLARNGGKKPLM